jgi:hypothetical protein
MLTVLTLLVIILGFFVNRAYGQHQQEGWTYALAKASLTSQGYTICEDKYGDLGQGQTAYFYRTYYANTTYRIVAISDDNDVRDVDIYVYYSDGTTVYTKDDDESPVSIVSFTPYVNRYLKVVFKNYASRTPDYRSTVRLLVGYK